MANYTTSTSDRSKDVALKKLLCGGIGLHLFYVGRIKAGLIRCIIGILIWIAIISLVFAGHLVEAACTLAVNVAINLPDFINIKLGKFQDNVGAYLREWYAFR